MSAAAGRTMRLTFAVATVTATAVAGLSALALSYCEKRWLGLPDEPGIVPMVVLRHGPVGLLAIDRRGLP